MMTSYDLHLIGAAVLVGIGAGINLYGNVKTQGLNNTVCMIRPGVTVNNPAINSAPKKMAIIALR